MAVKDKDQPGRDKPNESENQPQFASKDEARSERELGSSEEADTAKVSTGPTRPGLGDEKKPPNADD
jgi:hypothetical protein